MVNSNKKPTILVFINYYLPGYKSGGPVRTISNLVNELSDDFNFLIVTSDRDLHDTISYPGININAWNKVDDTYVYYSDIKSYTLSKVYGLIRNTPHDILYLNSFFDPMFTFFPLLSRRFFVSSKALVLLAPRGEFSEGALKFKQCKKMLFIYLTKRLGLYNNIFWHASSKLEKNDIIRNLEEKIKGNILIAPNFSANPNKIEINQRARKWDDPLRVVFLSRISPKKMLDYAIKVLAKVKALVEFDIYGPVDDNTYWEYCQKLIKRIPNNIKIDYKGSVQNNRVIPILASYDLFFFPTAGENFGHVIFESLSAGTSVLISDQTPWQDLDDQGVGWVRSLDDFSSFVNIIELYAVKGENEINKKRLRTKEYAIHYYLNSNSYKKNVKLFQKLLVK